MKKILAMILALVMLLALSVPCFAEGEEKVISGSLAMSCLSEDELTAYYKEKGLPFEVKYFDDLNSLILALKAGKIDEIEGFPESTAKYLAEQNNEFEASADNSGDNIHIGYYMGVLENDTENSELLKQIFAEMKEDGTLETLKEEYIDKPAESGENAEPAELPKFDGARTIRVAVTGDLPPFDYVEADGTPAGYNVALLSEIAKRAKVNIELVTMNTAARAMALTSGTVDVVFWFSGASATEIKPGDGDIPAGTVAIGPYYEAPEYDVVLKK